MLRTKDIEGSFSRSQSPNPFILKRMGDRVEGEVNDKHAAESGRSVTYDIVIDFFAPIETKAPEIKPTAADAEAAKKHPAVIAHLQLQDAIRKGDWAKIRSMAPSEAREHVDAPNFAEMLKLLQAMQEQDIYILKAVTNGAEKPSRWRANWQTARPAKAKWP